jgi:hypothetical protein
MYPPRIASKPIISNDSVPVFGSTVTAAVAAAGATGTGVLGGVCVEGGTTVVVTVSGTSSTTGGGGGGGVAGGVVGGGGVAGGLGLGIGVAETAFPHGPRTANLN